MNSPPLSMCSSRNVTGSRFEASSTAPPTRLIPLPQTGCTSVQSVVTSMTVSVVRKNPSSLSPQCRTKVRLDGAWLDVLPLAPGANRYLCFQTRCCCSGSPRLPAQPLTPVLQLPVDRRSTHREQSFTHTPAQLRFAMSLKGLPPLPATLPPVACCTSGRPLPTPSPAPE